MSSSLLSVVALYPWLPWLWFNVKDIFVLQLFGSVIIEACPYPTQDMLSIIAEKGQNSDEIFSYIRDKSHSSLKERIYKEELINWNEESVLTIASVFRVRKAFLNFYLGMIFVFHSVDCEAKAWVIKRKVIALRGGMHNTIGKRYWMIPPWLLSLPNVSDSSCQKHGTSSWEGEWRSITVGSQVYAEQFKGTGTPGILLFF